MKRILFALLAMLALVFPMRGQELITEDVPMPVERVMPKDSLSDLWIVLLDMSGSMKETGKKWKNVFNNKNNKEHVSKIVDSLVSKYGNKTKDVFVLLEFGADTDTLNRINNDSNYYSDNELVSNVIHERRTGGNDYSSMKKQVEELCNPRQAYLFNYGRSYTSVVRPLSMFVVAKKRKLDFLQYKNIYSLMITDNGDNASDQWSIDYNTTKKIWKKHFDCFKRILPTIASSEFDFTSIKSGKFIELETLDVPPYYFLSQFVTYQECNPEKELTADTLVMVSNFHNDRFTLQMKPCGDSVNFIYVDICRVNGHPIPVKQYLYLGDSVVVEYDKNYAKTFANKVSVMGSYQEIYTDRVLGLRYRKIEFGKTPEKAELSTTFVLEETKAIERKCLRSTALLLLAVLTFILIWRECVVLKIFVNGKCWSIKRKAMNKLKNDDFTLVTIAFDGDAAYETFFYKDKGIIIENDTKTCVNDGKLFIKSQQGLSPDYSHFVYNTDKSGKNINVNFDSCNVGDSIQFCFADRLSHNLIIRCEEKGRKRNGADYKKLYENDLCDCNLKMLARYYEQKAKDIDTVCNNVQVNIIRGGNKYKEDYAILNIFDLNSSNAANCIFLHYSLMCFYDGKQKTETTATEQLLEVADYVLQSERQKAGYMEKAAYTLMPQGKTGVAVEVSPLLSYLYLLIKGKSRLAYSPFADGYYGLASKVVKVFPTDTMTLLNLPFKYNNPEMKINGPTKVVLEKCYRENEAMLFLGNDVVRFLNVEKNWSSGLPVNAVDGVTYSSWSLDEIINDISKQ